MNLTLIRFAYLEQMTLGRLLVGVRRLATIERPWIPAPNGPGGLARRSCVPDGVYRVIPHTSERFPNTYALVNEKLGVYYQSLPPMTQAGRVAILIHIGNFVSDVVGCIAVGMQHGANCVVSSTQAMNQLRDVLGRTEHVLTIRPASATDEVIHA